MRVIKEILKAVLIITVIVGGSTAAMLLIESGFTPKYDGVVLVTYPSWPGASCSGVIVSDEFAMTAGHCALLPTTIMGMQVMLPMVDPIKLEQNGIAAYGLVVHVNNQRDMAIIKGDFKKLRKAKTHFSTAYFNVTHSYMSCGHPSGQLEVFCVSLGKPVSNDGGVSLFRQTQLWGASGGPVFDEESGELVGLNTWILPASMGGGSGMTPVGGIGRFMKLE